MGGFRTLGLYARVLTDELGEGLQVTSTVVGDWLVGLPVKVLERREPGDSVTLGKG
jgi:hypothetical protein